ncbi:MAG: hypothetical protein HND39_10240 [Ignavibacteriota bacterium]|nr:MAG: hypothetical protein EDM72_13075 [Chlorobiota bacterium]MBL1122085.1 hypothetical protein [Ignavibacteriota bacterium]MBV6418797.1 hypothetical protein [Ignavibacteriaceae bacterium]NUM63433.1 hypothetical protein [Ignavibacteriaceae bacterium]QKJ96627.1 MAG: hypothetical protein HND39_10240 [Ignavibacteriota bacterium]
MLTKKVKVIASTLVVLLFIIIFFAVREKYESNRFKNNFIDFDTTNIIGELEYVALASHGVVFRIKGNSKMFIFYPRTSELNKNRIFDHLAEKGDTIIKGKFSDTLKLIKNRNKYLYTFDQLK